MKIITVGSIKGGTGKTSVLILLARALAKSGRKGLLIDLDINDSLTSVLKPKNLNEIDVLENKHIAAALLSTKDDFADYIIPSNYPGIDLLRNHLQLSRVNFTQNLLKNKITVSGLADKYDYIIIDTPATYYALHIMAYQAADLIISPINLAKFDYHPLQQLAFNLKEDTGKLDCWRLFYNRVKPESEKQQDYFDMFDQKFSGRIFPNVKIPDTQKIRDCIDRKMLVGKSKEYAKLRTAICALASAVAETEINPETEENF